MSTYQQYLDGLKAKAQKKPKRSKAARLRKKKERLARLSILPKLGAPHPDYVKDDGFYKSRKWRELRYFALRNCQGCQCCGAKASDGVQLHVDHVLPRYRYPHLALELGNLQVLCDDCNIGKGAWDETDWRTKMELLSS